MGQLSLDSVITRQTMYLHSDTLYRMGTAYVIARLTLVLLLFSILSLTLDITLTSHLARSIYISSSVIYILLGTAQLFLFKYWKKFQQFQLFVYLINDVLYISLTLLLGMGPNLAIILLYMVVVLAATLLVSAKQALFLTLLSIIIVVYQQFFFTLWDAMQVTFVGNSALVTLVFISTYLLAQLTIRRMQFVETLALDQSQEIVQLQSINQNIVEQLATGCLVIDASGTIITVNKAALNMLQWQTNWDSNSNNLAQLEPDLYAVLQQHLMQQSHDRFYYKGPLPNAQQFMITYQPLEAHQRALILMSFESVQRINQQAQQLKLMALGQLSASIAHEIRNPLSAIVQSNDLLTDDQQPEQRLLTQMIDKQCKRINRIIDDTLNMSRQSSTCPQVIELDTWLPECIADDLADVAQFLKVELSEPIAIIFDPQQLRQVLINLVRNAIRHGHQQQPGSSVQLVIKRQQRVVIDIIDQGRGVSTTEQAQLFAPFYSTSVNGTGLGLYLAKTFCEANQASLSYIAQAQGACFRIECVAAPV